jgi:hypothetical protein
MKQGLEPQTKAQRQPQTKPIPKMGGLTFFYHLVFWEAGLDYPPHPRDDEGLILSKGTTSEGMMKD